jgi:hypothetical protein
MGREIGSTGIEPFRIVGKDQLAVALGLPLNDGPGLRDVFEAPVVSILRRGMLGIADETGARCGLVVRFPQARTRTNPAGVELSVSTRVFQRHQRRASSMGDCRGLDQLSRIRILNQALSCSRKGLSPLCHLKIEYFDGCATLAPL